MINLTKNRIKKRVVDFFRIVRSISLTLSAAVIASVLILSFASISVEAQSNSNLFPGSRVICGGQCPLIDPDFQFNRENIVRFILNIARFMTYVGTALAVLFIVYGGALIVVDFGSGDRAKAGWNCIRTSLIGLVIIITAYTIVAFVGSFASGNFLSSFTNS
jgi:hypothetical protein